MGLIVSNHIPEGGGIRFGTRSWRIRGRKQCQGKINKLSHSEVQNNRKESELPCLNMCQPSICLCYLDSERIMKVDVFVSRVLGAPDVPGGRASMQVPEAAVQNLLQNGGLRGPLQESLAQVI